MPTTPIYTTLGTPCARSWSNDWIATVDATERDLNHRICGARLPDGTPCCNQSDHLSGRCPYHGGFDLTGAPPGNRNHVIHGLYSRRLRPCTQTCPHWQTCPIANTKEPQESRHPRAGGDPSSQFPNPSDQSHTPDPTDRPDPSDSSLQSPASGLQPSPNPQSALRNPQSKSSLQSPASGLQPCPTSSYRSHSSYMSYSQNAKPPQSPPTCVYQLTEYNTVLTDALAIVESQPHPNPMGIHNAHNVAMLQVLVNAATTHLAQDANLWASEDTFDTPNSNKVLAFTRLMREFRHSLKLLHAPGLTPLNRHNSTGAPPTAEGILRHAQRIQHDTGLDPDSIDAAQLQPQTPETHAKAFIQQAALAGGKGRDVEMCEAFDNAALLDEPYAESERSHVLASYRPPDTASPKNSPKPSSATSTSNRPYPKTAQSPTIPLSPFPLRRGTKGDVLQPTRHP